MKIYQFERTQLLRLTTEKAWDYFSCPLNLPEITPPNLGFKIVSPVPERMYQGMLVEYTVTPFAVLPVRWVTEITHVREQSFFVDEQRFGPYRFWHHQHFFDAVPTGTRMRDLVSYGLPLDPFSRVIAPLVQHRLECIFQYRFETLNRLFG
ncbi:MAG: SRPBCC family protein [Trichlorobacter sp.]